MVTLATPQLSAVVGATTVTAALQTPVSAVAVWSAAHVIVGSSPSVTVISCVQVAVFPPLSVTVQVTVVVPNGYVPEASVVLLKSLVKPID